MHKPNTKLGPAIMAGILDMLARHGYEAELKPGQFHMDLNLRHIQPLSPEIIGILRENGFFEYCFLDKATYTDANGTIRCRSHFRRPY